MERLFGCDYGVFSWAVFHEMTFAGFAKYCISSSFAENLSKAKTKVCMSEDGQRVIMVHATCDRVDLQPHGMYFEVMQRPYLGAFGPKLA
jgi:hypothetical protein